MREQINLLTVDMKPLSILEAKKSIFVERVQELVTKNVHTLMNWANYHILHMETLGKTDQGHQTFCLTIISCHTKF